MTRRMIFILSALVGLMGVIFLLASPASAQTGLPFVFDFQGLFTRIFNSFPPFLQSFGGFISLIFGRLLSAFTGSCFPFCAS